MSKRYSVYVESQDVEEFDNLQEACIHAVYNPEGDSYYVFDCQIKRKLTGAEVLWEAIKGKKSLEDANWQKSGF